MTRPTETAPRDGSVWQHSGITVDGNTDTTTAIRKYLGSRTERLRQSDERRRNLQTYLFVKSGEKVRVSLGDYRTAAVTLKEGTPVVKIPTKRLDQLATEYDREKFDQIIQYGYADHERGHIQYTAGPYIESRLLDLSPLKRGAVKTLVNALEDGAIEEMLRADDISTGIRLSTLHANLAARKMQKIENGGFSCSFIRAVKAYILDVGRYDAGFTRMLLDDDCSALSFKSSDHETRFRDFRPTIEKAVADVLAEGEPKTRADRMFEFAEAVLEQSPRAPRNIPDDPDQRGMSSEVGEAPDDGRTDESPSTPPESADHDTTPENVRDRMRDILDDETVDRSDEDDDADDETGAGDADADDADADDAVDADDGDDADVDVEGDGDRAENEGDGESEVGSETDDDIGDTDADERDADGTDDLNDPDTGADDDPDERGDESGDADGDESAAEDDADPDPNAPEGLGDDEVETDEKATDGLDEDRRAEQRAADRQEREMEEALRSLGGSGGPDPGGATGNGSLEDGVTLVPPAEDFDADLWRTAAGDSDALMGQFGKLLDDQQRDGWDRGLDRGQVDPARLTDMMLGGDDCMRRRVRSDPDEFSVVLMIDRSGSMSSDDIACAERASAGLGMALERAGVDVCIMDMHAKTARVANPFEFPVAESREMIVTGETGGGTPLAEALSVAADRVRWKPGETFVVVITDGKPDNPGEYRDTLNDIGQFAHVLGVEIALNQSRDRPKYDENYHFGTSVADANELVDDIDRMMAEQAF